MPTDYQLLWRDTIIPLTLALALCTLIVIMLRISIRK